MDALVNPLAPAIITVTCDAQERPKALGLYCAALGIVGGQSTMVIAYLNHQFGWRATFGLVILLAAVGFILVSRFVKESKANGSKSEEWIYILLIIAVLLGVVYVINQAAAQGYGNSAILVPVGIGTLLLVILILYSSRTNYPVLHLRLFKNIVVPVGVLLFLLMGSALTGSFFQFSTNLQPLQKSFTIQASLTLLPYTLSLFGFAITAGGLVGKYPIQLLITDGLVVMMLGIIAVGFLLRPNAGFGLFLVPLVLLGGFTITNTQRISAGLATAPPEIAGEASAINNDVSQLGNALGIAIIGALFQGFARKCYFAGLTNLRLDLAKINKSVEALSAWLRSNSGDMANQIGITAQQLQGVITNYGHTYTTWVAQESWVAAFLVFIRAVLAWITFRKQVEKPHEQMSLMCQTISGLLGLTRAHYEKTNFFTDLF